MEQITHYFEHMDYVSFGVIALPCVIIAVYGFLQVASGLAKGKNDNMQRYNNNTNNNNNNSQNNNNNNSGNNSNSKRCAQKYANGNLATAAGHGPAATATAAATAAATTASNNYQQQQHQQSNNSKATRKSRYNNKRQDVQGTAAAAAAAAAYNMQKRTNAAGNDSSWHRFVSSSCIEEKYLGQHNPGHRNSTSSEATSEDINSSDEHLNLKPKCRPANNSHPLGGNNGNVNVNCNNGAAGCGSKSRSKRQQKAQATKQALARQTGQAQAQAQAQVQGQAILEQCGKSNGKCKQGKWRNNNNNNNNSSSSTNNCNQKRGNNGKAKQSKCNSSNNKPHNGHNNNNNQNSNDNNCNNSNISSSTKCGANSSNSSSALSSPGSSPNGSSCSSIRSSSGNSSGSGSGSIGKHAPNSVVGWQREERQLHKVQRQNVNFLVPPLRQYERLDIDDGALLRQLRRYLIDQNLLRVYGFPVASVVHDGAIEIFKCLPHMSFAAAHVMAVTETALTVINCHDGLTLNPSNFEEPNIEANEQPPCDVSSSSSSDSSDSPTATSTDSGNISPRSLDSESGGEWSGSECESAPSAESGYGLELYCNYALVERSLAKQCVRCKRDFLVDELSGQYLTREECSYHWGKYHRCYDGSAWISRWTCCNAGEESTLGCTRHELHVWTGSVVGVNGPYHDFVHTRPRAALSARSREPPAVYALDCEMSYTGRGLDVTKVSLVALNGQLVYEHYVRPDADIVDYNTRYSGVTAKDLKSSGVKTLAEVQRDLLELIDAETILIGHGLDNDLRALRIVHNTLIDTSIAFPHTSGFPYRRALRHLTKTHLNREIQCGDGATGHSSFEDSRACMELMLWRVRRELNANATSWDD
ncbi:GATA zinc finger domain-containing protein 7 isoform X2 [Drosophila virilis]|uniref:GATA zinc finger domain-containing protein 7 isoform X2 n=1 Tax=Drosophila virilis TaxID=7244 RepID=UPI0038B3AF6A